MNTLTFMLIFLQTIELIEFPVNMFLLKRIVVNIPENTGWAKFHGNFINS